ncbi:hypothetical protein [Spiroplasma endosymbiont of Nebria brevicollis]|uniref:hypothetical protein n=1 Tax=Spiroplasma endosymbiont of Nebria brevicollis TaxID=3066284 RepID=UPI00313DED9C
MKQLLKLLAVLTVSTPLSLNVIGCENNKSTPETPKTLTVTDIGIKIKSIFQLSTTVLLEQKATNNAYFYNTLTKNLVDLQNELGNVEVLSKTTALFITRTTTFFYAVGQTSIDLGVRVLGSIVCCQIQKYPLLRFQLVLTILISLMLLKLMMLVKV